MEICKLCGNEYKTVNMVHVRTHGIDMTQYAMYPEYGEVPDPIEPKGNTKVTKKEMEERIFGKQERDINRPLSEFLNEFGVTEKEAREILRKFTTGKRVDPRIDAKNNKRIGRDGAEKLKNQSEVETTSLHIAEELTVHHGFTCTELRGPRDGKPKTWFLEKL